ncbi:hypothetical protein BKA70DRAFT_1268424, partial [Coprinopsis sp. MPI-PUGE-AT-0042]
PAQPNPVFTLETLFVEYHSPVWTPTDEFTATLNLILAFFSILLLIPTSVFLSSANKGKRAGAGRPHPRPRHHLQRATPTILNPTRAAMETSMARTAAGSGSGGSGADHKERETQEEVEEESTASTTITTRPTGSLSSLSSLADSIFPGDDGPSGSGNSTDPTSAFNEVTSSGNESLDEAFVDQSLRSPQPPPVQHIKQEFHPGDPEDPDDPDGHIPGVFGDIPLADLPSASPVTLRMILNLVWRLSLAYALFGVYVGALKLTKYWSIRLLDFARQSIHDYARSQARRGSMKSALSNGHNTLSPSRRSPWYYKAILGLVAASTVLPQSPMGGFLNPSVPPPTSSLVARPACTGSVWRPPPTKTWVLGNYVEADYVVAASHHRSTVRFSIPSPYQSSIHHNNRPIALAEVLGRTLVAFPPIAGHLLHLLQGIATAFALALLAVVALVCVKQVCRFIHAFVLPLHVETNPDRDHDTVEQICIRLGIDDAFCYLPAGVAEATGPTTVYSADDELVSASDSDVSKLSLSPSRGGVMDALKADCRCRAGSRLMSPSSSNAVNVPLAAHHHLARKTRRVAQRSPLAAIFQPDAWHPASAPPQRLLRRKENMLHQRYVASQFLPANTRIFQGGIAGPIYGSFAKLKLAYQKKIALCDDSSEGLDLFCQHRLWFSDTLEILRRLYDWKFALILSEQMEEQHRFEYGELLTQANLAASGMADSASEDIANRLRAASMRLMAKREFRSSLFNRANPPPPINHHDVEPNSPFPTPPI